MLFFYIFAIFAVLTSNTVKLYNIADTMLLDKGGMFVAKVKSAKQDFDIARLPASRRQVFFDVYKNRASLMIDLGLLLLLFFLPLIAVHMLTLAQCAEIGRSLARQQLTAEEASIHLVQIQNAGNILSIPALMIFSVGLAGTAQVVKNLVWQEGVLLKGDFLQGIRSNWRCYSLTAMLAGGMHYVAQYLIHVGFFESGGALELGLVAVLAAVTLFALTIPFVLIQSTLYRLRYFQKFSNGFLLAMRTFLPTLGIVLVNVVPFLLLWIDDYTVHIFGMLLLPVLAVPPLMLLDTLYVHSVLDKYINRTHFPEIYRKGLISHADHPSA